MTRRPWFPALLLVTGVGPFGLDTYLAALSSLAGSLHTGATGAQLTVTTYIVGLAVGQLAGGPVSDSTGRRPVLLASSAAFTVLSLVCAVLSNAPVFIAARFVQGLVAGAGVACGRAVLSDGFRGSAGDTKFGTLAAVNLLSPVVAPAVGTLFLGVGGWRAVFVFMGVLGLLMTLAIAFGVPESLPPAERHAGGLTATLVRMADLGRDFGFLRHVIIACLATASFFTYIGGSSYALQTVYDLDSRGYAAVFTVNAVFMVVGSVAFRLLVGRVGPTRLRTAGLVVGVLSTSGLLAGVLAIHQHPGTLALPWVCLSGVTFAMGLMIPAAMTLAQTAGDRARGTASALQGGGMFLVGSLSTPLVGILGYTSVVPMAAAMAVLMAAAALAAVLTRSAGSRAGGVQLETATANPTESHS
ncbi:multidrug effflux MFS transporter [Cryptosporangium phraense]|uniref:multidrug effflux MFS transporter n=1 Tax=Cryptosporangium phraense TaxID=2593070 RepID=UPI0014795B7E|nr:multidrug effflux MFS transporter [Cryptosporangium phraense]